MGDERAEQSPPTTLNKEEFPNGSRHVLNGYGVTIKEELG